MENILVKEKIHYDLQEKRINKKWSLFVIVLSFISFILMFNYLSLKYSFLSVFVFSFLDYDGWRNYFILNNVKCTNCNSKYFKPFIASKDDIKFLLKSNPKCAKCNYEAEIISEYKTMY